MNITVRIQQRQRKEQEVSTIEILIEFLLPTQKKNITTFGIFCILNCTGCFILSEIIFKEYKVSIDFQTVCLAFYMGLFDCVQSRKSSYRPEEQSVVNSWQKNPENVILINIVILFLSEH